MENTIDINELLDEGYVLGKVKIFIEQEMEGDMVEEVISMIWDDEYNYGNPHNLTEQEHDNLVHSYVENIIWKECLIYRIGQITKQDSSLYSKNNIEELEKKFWELKKKSVTLKDGTEHNNTGRKGKLTMGVYDKSI